MPFARRSLGLLALFALALPFAAPARADTYQFNGNLTADNSVVLIPFSSTISQTYSATTTSFASGGFVPVLTVFNASGGVPITFAENDMGDVSLSGVLGPGNYLLAVTEDPNVFTTTLAAGTLFASSPNITGSLCGVAGGTFLDVFDNCSQRTNAFAISVNATAAPTPPPAATPEPPTWLMTMPVAGLLAFAIYRRQTV